MSRPEAAQLPWHAAAWSRLDRARRDGRLPHALLLSGPSGLGKSVFARRLSDALVCAGGDGDACGRCAACRQAAAGSHPDQRWIGPEAPGKAIRIDAIRDVIRHDALTAQPGGYRVTVIDPADAMNRAAANALLKTLEEPASRSVLILVSSHPDRLLPTIRSRCQIVPFALPAEQTSLEWLASRVDTEARPLLAIAGGAPLRALLASAEAWPDDDRRLLAELADLRARRVNPVRQVEEWAKRPMQRLGESFKRCLVDLVAWRSGAREGARFNPGLDGELQNLCRNIDLKDLFALYADLLAFEREHANNLNQQMTLEHVAVRWLEITRPGGR